VEFLRDDDRAQGWLVVVDGVPQSYVDPGDPTYLDFDYVRLLAAAIDTTHPAPAPVRAVHLGGAGLTLPRWLTATRPRSSQLVFEPDEELTALVRERLPLPRASGIRVRPQDGRSGLAGRDDESADLVVLDAFLDGRVPPALTTLEFAVDVSRVLRPGGVYVANIADAPPLSFARRFAATIGTVFAFTALLAEPTVLRGRRSGNLVLVASNDVDLKEHRDGALGRGARAGPFPARVLAGNDVSDFVGGAKPISDAALLVGSPGLSSPEPPDGTWRIPRI
jgi:spermidine synthase